MRAYLSSFRLGDHPEELLALTGPGARVGVVANAVDALPAAERAVKVDTELAALAGLGLCPHEVDLRTLTPATVGGALGQVDALWVRGGNVFVLRQAMAASGADHEVAARLRTDSLVYAGYSAGPCVLAPSLTGLEHCDPVGDVETAFGVPARFDGLGVLPYAIVPHLDTPGHPESELLAAVAAAYERDGVPHRRLRDGQALVVDGDAERVV